MTVSVGFLLALFLLAPGLAVHAALFPATGTRGIRFAPPPPSSILALTCIGLGALGAHTLWSGLHFGNATLCSATSCIPTSFEPNIYQSLLAANSHSRLTGTDVAVALANISVLTLIAYFATGALAHFKSGQTFLRSLRFGWLSDFVELAEPDNRYSTAFVLTSIEHEGAFLGYEGLIENLAVNADREITSLTLLDANRFLVTIARGRVVRSTIKRDTIDRIYIDKANIRNVAMTVFETEDQPSAPAIAP